MARRYYNYGRRKSSGASIWMIVLLFTFLSGFAELFEAGIGIMGVILTLLGGLFIMSIPVLLLVGFIVLLVKMFSSLGNKKKVSRSATSISSRELLEDLQKYFNNNAKLDIDADTYIVCTNPNGGQSLYDYDIFMNDEYVSDLQLFANSFPSGFNAFANLAEQLIKEKTSGRKKKKTQETPVVQETTKEAEKKVEESSNCAFYIRTLNELNRNIPNEQITDGLNQTVKYLQQIDKIEKEFPECKNKTKKLYQYYLPMLTDILKNYNRLNFDAVENEDFKASEDRLVKTIVLINGALKTISSSLTEDYYTDLKVDMKTLESVLKKDGLVDDMKEKTSGLEGDQ